MAHFIYTGFKPAFVIIKNVTNGTGDWYMYDNKRGDYKWMIMFYLRTNGTDGGSGDSDIDILVMELKLDITIQL